MRRKEILELTQRLGEGCEEIMNMALVGNSIYSTLSSLLNGAGRICLRMLWRGHSFVKFITQTIGGEVNVTLV
jgi:hypothetical protein